MLMELKQTIKEGDVVPLTLVLEGSDGKRHQPGSQRCRRARWRPCRT